jgi:signal transduction histidine kinase
MAIRKLIESHLGPEMAQSLVGGRILAVDDDDGNLAVLEELLMDDFDITLTESPGEALRLATEGNFDMVISDQRMPGMTGVELLKEIRRIHPDTVRIIISAYSDASAILAAINEGQVYRFILKPWSPEEVETVVKQGLEHRMHVLAIRKLVEELAGKNVSLERALGDLQATQHKLLHSAKLATVGQLTASIVHELKNHITGVRLLTEIVEESIVPEEFAEYVQTGHDSAQALFDLISGINAFARQDDWKLRRRRTDLIELLNSGLSIVRSDRRSKQRSLTFAPAADVPPVVLDPDKIRQVVVNLLRNALDATDTGGQIELTLDMLDDNEVRLKVCDDGTGISEEKMKQVFKPFYTTKENGLGLGLEICRNIVEAHGGQMTVESTVGQGTTLSAVLPVQLETTE